MIKSIVTKKSAKFIANSMRLVFRKEYSFTQYFIIGLILKMILGTLLASDFLTELFIPFINYFVGSNFQNPYEYFIQINKSNAFPYPVLMLLTFTIPKLLLGWVMPNSVFFTLFIYRIPLLIADIFILFILKSWMHQKQHRKLLLLYWFSPVLIYINYMHGQLDAIPIAFLFISLYFLFKKRNIHFIIFYGFALASKTSISLTIPFILIFLFYEKKNLFKVLLYLLAILFTFILINLPYLFNESFISMVFQNKEQVKIFQPSLQLYSIQFYLIPASLFCLIIRGLLIPHYTKNIFIIFLSFLYSVVLFFVPPQQGWYYWLLPFLVFFYVKEYSRSIILLIALQTSYILYFLVFKESDYIEIFQYLFQSAKTTDNFYAHFIKKEINTTFINNMFFTLLQTTLLINCVWIYQRGVAKYIKKKIIGYPYMIGIGGNSGVGKTRLAEMIENTFSQQNTLILRGDDMHKWHRHHENWEKITQINPKAHYLHREIHTLKELSNGKTVIRKIYNHDTGNFDKGIKIHPTALIVHEGLHPFFLENQRKVYDVKIFIAPEKELGLHWKIIRDKIERNYSQESILQKIKERYDDVKKYIEPQRNYADILIEPYTQNKIETIGSPDEIYNMQYRITFSNSVYLEPIVRKLQGIPTINIEHLYDDQNKQKIIISGTCPAITLLNIAKAYIPDLSDMRTDLLDWKEDIDGLLLLIIIYYIYEGLQ